MKKMLTAAGAAVMLAAAAMQVQAADAGLIQALTRCDAGFFTALAQDKNIPENLKIRDGKMAYFKITQQPLEEIRFKGFKDHGLEVIGFVANDEIIRYFGVPDMHNHFWGLLVKNDWEKTLTKLDMDWDMVDMNHKQAHMPLQIRANGSSTWKKYTRPTDRKMPDFGFVERGFHVAPYKGDTLLFCSMQSAGAPDGAILADTRPDLMYGDNEAPVTTPSNDANRPADADKADKKADAKPAVKTDKKA